ncbi:MAG TPA: M23 family metallopeptidase [Treponemataceae bacterium]|nr:M23 family metallopeptidase [Treponemataceae bacterium]
MNFLDLWGLECVSDKASKAEVRNGIATPVGNTFDDMVVTSEWGPYRPSMPTKDGDTKEGHNGMDFAAPKGTRVNAVMDGEVIYVDDIGNGDYGKVTIIAHSNDQKTLYAHQDTIIVEKGDKVEAGQKIGTVGSTGKSTGDHLHLGYDSNGDPLK